MLGLKLNHYSKRGPWKIWYQHYNSSTNITEEMVLQKHLASVKYVFKSTDILSCCNRKGAYELSRFVCFKNVPRYWCQLLAHLFFMEALMHHYYSSERSLACTWPHHWHDTFRYINVLFLLIYVFFSVQFRGLFVKCILSSKHRFRIATSLTWAFSEMHWNIFLAILRQYVLSSKKQRI